MECRTRDLHDFFNVTWQTVDVRKARKIVMKSEIVLNKTYKRQIKNVRIFDHEKKFGLKKIAKLLSYNGFTGVCIISLHGLWVVCTYNPCFEDK